MRVDPIHTDDELVAVVGRLYRLRMKRPTTSRNRAIRALEAAIRRYENQVSRDVLYDELREAIR